MEAHLTETGKWKGHAGAVAHSAMWEQELISNLETTVSRFEMVISKFEMVVSWHETENACR